MGEEATGDARHWCRAPLAERRLYLTTNAAAGVVETGIGLLTNRIPSVCACEEGEIHVGELQRLKAAAESDDSAAWRRHGGGILCQGLMSHTRH
jgi:hypothetical protein